MDGVDKVAWSLFFLLIFAGLVLIGLFGWVVVALVNWITSK